MATTITIRHVPEDVRNELAARAARHGQSLQEFMLGELVRLASRPSPHELRERIRGRKERSPRHIDRAVILDDRDADRR